MKAVFLVAIGLFHIATGAGSLQPGEIHQIRVKDVNIAKMVALSLWKAGNGELRLTSCIDDDIGQIYTTDLSGETIALFKIPTELKYYGNYCPNFKLYPEYRKAILLSAGYAGVFDLDHFTLDMFPVTGSSHQQENQAVLVANPEGGFYFVHHYSEKNRGFIETFDTNTKSLLSRILLPSEERMRRTLFFWNGSYLHMTAILDFPQYGYFIRALTLNLTSGTVQKDWPEAPCNFLAMSSELIERNGKRSFVIPLQSGCRTKPNHHSFQSGHGAGFVDPMNLELVDLLQSPVFDYCMGACFDQTIVDSQTGRLAFLTDYDFDGTSRNTEYAETHTNTFRQSQPVTFAFATQNGDLIGFGNSKKTPGYIYNLTQDKVVTTFPWGPTPDLLSTMINLGEELHSVTRAGKDQIYFFRAF